MGAFDNFRNVFSRGKGLGIELGRELSAVELKGTPPTITAAGHSSHAGYSGAELGGWLARWLKTMGTSAKRARVVVVEGDIQHHIVTMPEMSDRERHLAVGAEVRKLSPVPASQLSYSHMAVGAVEEAGVSQHKVLISAVDKSTLRNALTTVESAGLSVELVTTVPAALVKAADLLAPVAGDTAIAYLAAGRSYLVVIHNGVVELVRDFALRATDRDFDPKEMTDLITAELRRSFLYFGQRVRGGSVDRLVLAGPMSTLTDLSQRLSEGLGIEVEPFDASGAVQFGIGADPFDQPALAVAMGAATMSGTGAANLLAPEAVAEGKTQRFVSVGRIAAAVVAALVLGAGLLALLDTSVQRGRLAGVEQRVAVARQELDQARATAQTRRDHQARRSVLESRGQESTVIGVLLQHLSQRIPDPVAIESIVWAQVPAPGGEVHWDVQVDGFVLGASRSESQAMFNRFYTLLVNDPIVDDVHMVEPLVIGYEAARTLPALTAAVQNPADRRALTTTSSERQRALVPGEVRVETSLDDLPPFEGTETSVGFKVAVQLKALGAGGGR